MAAALRVHFGSEWTTSILNSFGIHSTVCDEFNNNQKRKHDRDSAHKISLKYKKQQLMTRYDQQTVKCSPDSSYGNNPSEPDVLCDELKCMTLQRISGTPAGTKYYVVTAVLLNFIIMHQYCR